MVTNALCKKPHQPANRPVRGPFPMPMDLEKDEQGGIDVGGGDIAGRCRKSQ
jgi:hypothetical protein